MVPCCRLPQASGRSRGAARATARSTRRDHGRRATVSRIDPRPDRRGATSQASPSHVTPCIPGLAQRRAATPREALRRKFEVVSSHPACTSVNGGAICDPISSRPCRRLPKRSGAVLTRQEKLITTLREPLGRLGYRLEAVMSKASRAPQSGHPPGRASGVSPLACPECSRTFALPLHLGISASCIRGRRHRCRRDPHRRAERNGRYEPLHLRDGNVGLPASESARKHCARRRGAGERCSKRRRGSELGERHREPSPRPPLDVVMRHGVKLTVAPQ